MAARPNPVGWFEIYVQDMARAARFYETVLDVQLTQLPNNYMYFKWITLKSSPK